MNTKSELNYLLREAISSPYPIMYLRQNGVKTRVRHYRKVSVFDNITRNDTTLSFKSEKVDFLASKINKKAFKGNVDFWPRGGATEIDLTFGDIDVSAKALCHPNDNYVKRDGIKYAISKLLGDE